MKHYIITRFNYKYGFSKGLDVSGKTKEGVEWIRQRLILFYKYYIPSIKNQTCQDFEIVFLCDKDSPRLLLEELSEFGKPIHIPLKEWFKTTELPVITSRLDSDDCLHKDYVKNIQEECAKKEVEKIIDINPAFYLVDENRCGIINSRSPSQFLSTYSKTHKRFSCSTEHPRMRLFFDKYTRLNFIGALHVVHGGNASITDHYRRQQSIGLNLEDYGL